MSCLYRALLLLFFSLEALHAQTILIDPGHGGDEFGAVGHLKNSNGQDTIKEKDLALEISKRLRNLLVAKNYRVFLTRSTDRTVTLQERARYVDLVGADLFISVHVNSNTTSESEGFETYFLNNHKNAAVKKVEDAENYNSDLPADIQHILTDLVVQRTVDTSRKLASEVHQAIKGSLATKYKMKDRGVRAGLFYVLALSKIPGILLETGFISNPDEILKLNNPNYKNDYAMAVSNGIDSYFENKKKQTSELASLTKSKK